MSTRATSLTKDSGIAINREIDSRYDSVKYVADNMTLVENAASINGADLSIVAGIDLPELIGARDDTLASEGRVAVLESSTEASATQSSNSAAAALLSETNAEGSSTTASTSALAASGSAVQAANSATAAHASSLSSGNSATAASGSATASESSAVSSSGSATAASGSAVDSAASAVLSANSAVLSEGYSTDSENSAIAAAASASSIVPPTPASILADLITVDGPGSGLNADMLDNYTWNNVTNTDISTNRTITAGRGGGGVSLTVNDGQGNASVTFNHRSGVPEQDGNSARIVVNTDSTVSPSIEFKIVGGVTGGTSVLAPTVLRLTTTDLKLLGNTMWHSGNDGAGSGLDADLLGGITSSSYTLNTNISNVDNTADVDKPVSTQQQSALDLKLNLSGGSLVGPITTNSTIAGRDVALDGAKLDSIEGGATADQTPAEILTAVKTVDGSGSGLDADLFRGADPSQFATAAQGVLADSAMQLTDDTGWLYPTLLNGWVVYGIIYGNSIKYRRDPSGLVEIRGLVRDGLDSSIIFSLPVGFRPLEDIILSTVSSNTSRLDIRADGSVFCNGSGASFFSVNCLFYAG